jgi:hypothetical protein
MAELEIWDQVTKPELFFGLVAPIGTDLSKVSSSLQKSLVDGGYRCEEIHLIELVHELDRWKELLEPP